MSKNLIRLMATICLGGVVIGVFYVWFPAIKLLTLTSNTEQVSVPEQIDMASIEKKIKAMPVEKIYGAYSAFACDRIKSDPKHLGTTISGIEKNMKGENYIVGVSTFRGLYVDKKDLVATAIFKDGKRLTAKPSMNIDDGGVGEFVYSFMTGEMPASVSFSGTYSDFCGKTHKISVSWSGKK